MKRFLKALVSWLDRKFPDKVVITTETYVELLETVSLHTEAIEKHVERIKELEGQMGRINIQLGYSVPKMGMMER